MELRDGRDVNSLEDIFVELNRVGFDGAVNIEWEDNDTDQFAGPARRWPTAAGPT